MLEIKVEIIEPEVRIMEDNTSAGLLVRKVPGEKMVSEGTDNIREVQKAENKEGKT